MSDKYDVKDVEKYREYLQQQLANCDKTVSTEGMRAQMWVFCLPAALSMYTIAGVLERIAECIGYPSDDEEEAEDE